MSCTCFQIVQIPDLTLNKYTSLADCGVEGVLNRHRNFLRQWHGIAKASGTSFHLMYYFLPDEIIGKRLKLFFVIQGEDEIVEELIPLLMKSPLSDFYELVPSELPEVKFSAGATLIKKERITPVFNKFTGNEVLTHYVPKWEMNENCRLYDLFRIMETIGVAYESNEPCAYRLDLYPVSRSEQTRKVFTPIMKELQGENGIQLVKDQNYSRDTHAQNILNEYEEWLKKTESTPLFAVNVYGFAQNKLLSKVILNAVGSEAVSEGDFTIKPIKMDDCGYFTLTSRLDEEARGYCDYKEAKLKEWATTFTLEEVEPFFRFPALNEGENIELPKETKPIMSENGIQLGKDEQGHAVYFPIDDLPRHAFFSGMPGSGKTNTMLHIVSELRKKKIPFLVLEPAKKEYRALLTSKNMDDVYLFSPHLQSHFPLRMNPFEFPIGTRLSDHITAVMEVFQGSFYLTGNVLRFLNNSVVNSYIQKGWDIEELNHGELEYPTFDDVKMNLKKEIEESSYDAEIKGNARGFLEVRLAGLMERDAGELYNTPTSTLSPEEWLETSAIVELENLDEASKNFFVLLICHYILETLRVNPTGGIDETGKLMATRHVLFIEEAHNIIASTSEQASESIDPKISATQYIKKMLAEVRALRESIIIADQIPTALTSEVLKNTGLKIVHRLTSQDDREVIGTAINCNPVQFEQMATFSKGKSLIYHEKTLKPFIVQISEYKNAKVDYNFSIDEELYENIKSNEVIQREVYSLFQTFVLKHIDPLENSVIEFVQKLNEIAKDPRDTVIKCFNRDRMMLIATCRKQMKRINRYAKLYQIEEMDEDIQAVYQYGVQAIQSFIHSLESIKIEIE